MNRNTIVAATGNAHKLKEIRAVLAQWEVLSQTEAGFRGEVEETGVTFAENALLKAQAVCRATGLPALADDSGLCVNALGGAPGVYSARYSGGGDAENRALLLKNLAGEADRSAFFSCALALVFPDGKAITAEGRTHGKILTRECGENGFGYDSLFFSTDLQKSFGEVSEAEKNGVSHRGRALRALEKLL
jgi:XTP/dITP diphosphohydrolase